MSETTRVKIERVTDADLGKRKRCALCDATLKQARYMVEGPTGRWLCDYCAVLSAAIIVEAEGGGQ